MDRKVTTFAAVAALALTGVARADYADGLAAYQRGEYVVALAEYTEVFNCTIFFLWLDICVRDGD